MSKVHARRRGVAIVAVAALLVTAVLAWKAGSLSLRTDWSSGVRPAAEVASAALKPPGKTREKNPTSIDSLIVARRVEPGMVRRLSGRAFLIDRPRENRPPGDAAAFARTLLPASADGDSTASYRLYLIAAECETAVLPDVVESYRLIKDLVAPDYPKVMARQMEECEGLLMDPVLSDSRRWINLAAAQGSVEAAAVYSLSIDQTVGGPEVWAAHPERVIEYKQLGMRYLNEAAALGYLPALQSLSQTYEAGFLAPADPVKALAYWLALVGLSPQPAGLEKRTRWLEEGLSVAQRRDAQQQAAELRQRCCMD